MGDVDTPMLGGCSESCYAPTHGDVDRRYLSISGRLHKKTASLRSDGTCIAALEVNRNALLLYASTEFGDPPQLVRFEEETFLIAESATEKQRRTLLCSSQPRTKRITRLLSPTAALL